MSTAAGVRERPLIFSAPMVKAILDGRKTMSRRVIDLMQFGPDDTPGYDWIFRGKRGMWSSWRNEEFIDRHCRYGRPGDRLWVRETHWRNGYVSRWCVSEPIEPVWITAQPLLGQERAMRGCFVRYEDPGDPDHWTKRPSIHMPRWASRITLELTDVRVERVQDITEEDAIAEGVPTLRAFLCSDSWHEKHLKATRGQGAVDYGDLASHRAGFGFAWDCLNAKRGHPWAANVWVWVLTFRRLEPTP